MENNERIKIRVDVAGRLTSDERDTSNQLYRNCSYATAMKFVWINGLELPDKEDQ